jgi:hypothetical protein
MTQKNTKEATRTGQEEPENQGEWVEWARAKMMAMEARIETLKYENKTHKQTIRQMDIRIMKRKL